MEIQPMKVFTPEEIQNLLERGTVVDIREGGVKEYAEQYPVFIGLSLSTCIGDVIAGHIPLANLEGIISSTHHGSLGPIKAIESAWSSNWTNSWSRRKKYHPDLSDDEFEKYALTVFLEIMKKRLIEPREFLSVYGHYVMSQKWIMLSGIPAPVQLAF